MSISHQCRLFAAVVAVALLWTATAGADADTREIWVNGLRLNADEILLLEDVVGVRLRSGAYIYDPETGAVRAVAMSDTAAASPPHMQYADADEGAAE